MSDADAAPLHARFDLPEVPDHHERPKSSGSDSAKGRNRSSVVEDNFPTSAPQDRLPPHSWNRRPRSPNLKWYKHFDRPESCRHGRVFLVDYVKREHSTEGMRKVVALEINNEERLKKVYASSERGHEAVLRVLHVQNAPWAISFLLKKYNISDRQDLVGTTFGRYVKFKRPESRGGKPFLSGKSWKTTHDPWRRTSRTSFGLDHLKPCRVSRDAAAAAALRHSADKMMELNCYDGEDNPIYGYDVFVQRISCYIQKKEGMTGPLPSPDIPNPYEEAGNHGNHDRHGLRLEDLDNENTIIIFENSQSGSINDTLITPRQEWESKWRRLPFYLTYDQHDVSNDDRLATDCMRIILQDLMKSVTDNWEGFLDIANNHVSILEDKIYESPADESRAPELWTNSSWWLKAERLISIHSNLVKEMQLNLRELSDTPALDDHWLESSASDMERVSTLCDESLSKPTANLADLMYKSVEIRDARHSIQLNTSMWRLSWITFIFLPLNFISTVFGMNLNLLSHDPSIKWYFVVAVPLMALVFLGWFLFKYQLVQQRQTPYSRGVYDHLFQEMSTEFPALWSRSGPREFVRPSGMLDRLRWRLILFWNMPEKTIRAGTPDKDAGYDDDLGAWASIKRMLTRRWTSQIRRTDKFHSDEHADVLESGAGEGTELVGNTIGEATNVLTAPVTGPGGNLSGGMLSVELPPGLRTAQQITESRQDGTGRSSSSGSARRSERNSGVMVEEEKPTWLQDFASRVRYGHGGSTTVRDDGSRRPSFVPSSAVSDAS